MEMTTYIIPNSINVKMWVSVVVEIIKVIVSTNVVNRLHTLEEIFLMIHINRFLSTINIRNNND